MSSRAFVEGIRNNSPYILTHAECRDEIGQLYRMLDEAFPKDQQAPPERRAFENPRQELIRKLRAMPVKD